MHFFWSVKNLFLNEYYIFVELYYFECGLKTWSICIAFWGVKKNYFLMDVIFNIMQVEMDCVTFMSTQHDSFIKRVKWVGSDQPALLTGQVRVERS